jgi:hypothetical protein
MFMIMVRRSLVCATWCPGRWGAGWGIGGLVAVWVVMVVAGCGRGDVDIIGRCELLTDAVRPLDEEPRFPAPEFAPSVGLLDGQAWVTWMVWEGTSRLDSNHWVQWGRWYDEAWAPLGPPHFLGERPNHRSQWVRHGGELVGQTWVDPEGVPEPLEKERVHRVRVPPPGAGEPWLERIEVPASEVCPDCGLVGLGDFGTNPGFEQGLLPAAVGFGDVWLVFGASPAPCAYDRATPRWHRLHLVRGPSSTVAEAMLFEEGVCEPRETGSDAETNPMLVPLDDGALGLFYRRGVSGGDGLLRYVPLAADGQVVGEPRVVDGRPFHTQGNGFQPRAVAVPGGRVLLMERRAPSGVCPALRIMNADGSRARDAPWQLPCIRTSEDGDRSSVLRTQSVALVPVPGAAVLVWGQQRSFSDIQPDEAGVFAVLLTPEGRRGSEVVMLTELSGVSGGPGITVGADAEGDEVAAVWWDSRSLPDVGVHARRLRCTVGE